MAVRPVIYKDGKLLCVRNRCYAGGGNKDGASVAKYLMLPGGGVDPSEPLESALVRETIEELGVKPRVGRLLFISQFYDRSSHDIEKIEFFFLVDNPEDFDRVDLSKTTHGAKELAEIGFYDPKSTKITPSFFNKLDLEDFINNLRPVCINSYFDRQSEIDEDYATIPAEQ
jgi:8-oxo-dGTP pyrophosphatase MutT (NUDIX family)